MTGIGQILHCKRDGMYLFDYQAGLPSCLIYSSTGYAPASNVNVQAGSYLLWLSAQSEVLRIISNTSVDYYALTAL